MSLILDALNKADREREYRDAVPDLHTVHATPRPERDYRLLWLISGLGVALILVLALLLVLWWRTPEPQVAPEPMPAPAEPSSATVVAETPPVAPAPPAVAAVEVPIEAAAPAPQAPFEQEVKALYQTQQDTQVMQVVEPQIQPAQPEPVVMTPAARPRRSSVDEELARVLWEESRREMQQPIPASAMPQTPITPQPETKAPEAKPLPADLPQEETLAGHAAIPFLHELPVSVQDTIPTLMYAKHEYEKGFVVINKEEVQVGSAAQGGVLLERILADGVLLSLNGTEFKLSSLSSWVNY